MRPPQARVRIAFVASQGRTLDIIIWPLVIMSLGSSQIRKDAFPDECLSCEEIGGDSCPSERLGSEYFNYRTEEIMLINKELRLPFESKQLDVRRENALTHSSALKDKRELFYLQNSLSREPCGIRVSRVKCGWEIPLHSWEAHSPGLSDSKSPGLATTPLPRARAATRGHLQLLFWEAWKRGKEV